MKMQEKAHVFHSVQAVNTTQRNMVCGNKKKHRDFLGSVCCSLPCLLAGSNGALGQFITGTAHTHTHMRASKHRQATAIFHHRGKI